MPSNAMRNVWLNEREKQLRANGDYGLVKRDVYTGNTGRQELSTSYAVVTGSERTFTPKYSDSRIYYRFYFYVSYKDAHGIGHFRIYYNNSHDTAWDSSFSVNSSGHMRQTIEYSRSSWGAGVGRQIEIRAREYASANEIWLHQTQHWDGSGTDRNAGWQCVIEEYRTPPQTILDLGID